MKISLNQPNGFNAHFAPSEHKYLDARSESNLSPIQTSSMQRIGSIPTSITEEQWSPSQVMTSWLLAVTHVSQRDTASSPGLSQNWFSSLTRPSLLPPVCSQISVS